MFVNSPPPDPDTLEISLFGTGIGEAIAVHVGDGVWVLVDSCKPKISPDPLNLAYLKSLGVNPATQVKQIIATHWHDDHVNGLSDLVEQCQDADLVFTQALESDEFLSIVGSFSKHSPGFDKEKSGVREMSNSLRTLLKRKSDSPDSYRPPVKTQAGHRIFRRGDCEVFSLSPSPGAIEEATQEIALMWKALEEEARGINGPRPTRSAIPCPDRNINAVAIWVKWGDRRILLGSDLEEYGNRLLGWQAVLECNQFPDMPARVFKVPHHGSPNGDYQEVWNNIVTPNGMSAILTAYNRGRTPRPAPDDIKRIKQNANDIYYTSLPKRTANRYNKTVERTMKGGVLRRQSLGPTPGHIQVRWDASGKISVQLSGAAGKI